MLIKRNRKKGNMINITKLTFLTNNFLDYRRMLILFALLVQATSLNTELKKLTILSLFN